jgi:class 3 adenylate cyclase
MREQRKVVTALLADVVGSTALTERLDPEDAMEVLGGAITRVIAAIESLGGTVKDLAGDGALALFGAPHPHEDDAQGAARAGLEIIRSIDEYSGDLQRRGLDPVSIRVGSRPAWPCWGPWGREARLSTERCGTR